MYLLSHFIHPCSSLVFRAVSTLKSFRGITLLRKKSPRTPLMCLTARLTSGRLRFDRKHCLLDQRAQFGGTNAPKRKGFDAPPVAECFPARPLRVPKGSFQAFTQAGSLIVSPSSLPHERTTPAGAFSHQGFEVQALMSFPVASDKYHMGHLAQPTNPS